MNDARLHAEFIGDSGERILVVLRTPRAGTKRCAILVPPFAEEMNKSRRMFTLLGAALVERGWSVVLPDLYGTGDSDGEFAAATWHRWQCDVRNTAAWCDAQGLTIQACVGVRLGCALAASALADRALRKTVFWQPVAEGARAVDQFIRLRVAASMLDEDRRETIGGLRRQLQTGDPLEIAGYSLSATMVRELDAVRLVDAIGAHLGELHWMEVVRAATPEPSPATSKLLEALRSRGQPVQYRQSVGEVFWTATEVAVAEELLQQTVDVLNSP